MHEEGLLMTAADTPPAALPNALSDGPKGVQLQGILESHIADLEPGTPLPSERDLAERYGVARMTVRGEIERLVQRRLVYRQQGRGTFVAERRFAHTEQVTSFTEVMQARGVVAGSRLIGAETIVASETLAARMEIPAGAEVLRLRRVRTADDRPVAVEESRLPAARFPGLADEDLQRGSLYEILASKYDVHIVDAVYRLTAVVLDDEEARLLEAQAGLPALHAESVVRGEDDAIIECVSSTYRGDQYEAVMHARRDRSDLDRTQFGLVR